MNDAPLDIGIQNNFSDPLKPLLGKPLPILGTVVFLDHQWNDTFSSTVGYSGTNISNTDGQLPSDYHAGHYMLGTAL